MLTISEDILTASVCNVWGYLNIEPFLQVELIIYNNKYLDSEWNIRSTSYPKLRLLYGVWQTCFGLYVKIDFNLAKLLVITNDDYELDDQITKAQDWKEYATIVKVLLQKVPNIPKRIVTMCN